MRITIVLLTTLATLAPAQAQDVRFHDAQGRVTGSARTDANGVTTFLDAVGRATGPARGQQQSSNPLDAGRWGPDSCL